MRKTKRCKHGLFTYYTQDYYIGGALEVTGENSPKELERLKLMVRPDAHVIMAGANIGTLAVPMAQYLTGGMLMAFEPEPDTFRLLRKNFIDNDLVPPRAIAAELAISSRIGRAWITRIDYAGDIYNSGSAAVVDPAKPDEGEIAEIDTITVDSLPLDRLDLLHADVEGSELDVILGARETINRWRPFIYVENNHEGRSMALINALTDLGYRCHWHLPPLFNPDPAGGILVSANMLCTPAERQVDRTVLEGTLPVLWNGDTHHKAFERLSARIAEQQQERAMR